MVKSMNILIKLMSIVSLVIAPTIAKLHHNKIEAARKAKIETLILMDKVNETTHLTTADIMAPAAEATETTVTTVNGKVDEAGDFVYDLGQATEVTLPNQTKINPGSNSRMLTLSKDLQNKDAKLLDKSNWYTIENLYFESGSSNLKEASKEALNNLYQLLNAYPTAEVKLGGYTDNTGDSLMNVKLSATRAESTKAALVKMGIDAKRIATEGYGPMFPICPLNSTPECKALNRRIDVRVTKF